MKKWFLCILPIITACGSSKQYDSAPPTPSSSNSIINQQHNCDQNSCEVPKKQEKAEQLNSPLPDHCAKNMVFIKGEYCNKFTEHCLEWMDDPKLQYARCKRYKSPSMCLVNKIHMEYCIDKEELHDDSGMPYGDLSWLKAKELCETDNKRLCNQSEWTFAASGEEMLPYIWGYEFRNDICNMERTPAVCNGKLCDYRANITEYPLCMSPFGVHNMTGNVDEFIEVPLYSSSVNPGMTMRSALMGGHFLGGRHKSYVKTVDHNETFTNPPTIGSRCCSYSE